MMKRRITILIFGLWQFCQAQDVHFVQHGNAPLHTNPALTGLFQGDIRAVVNYRNQWSRDGLVPFNTGGFSGDYRFKKWSRQKDVVGVGAKSIIDVSGDGKFRTTTLGSNVSFIKNLKNAYARSKHQLSVGLSFGIINYSFDVNRLNFGDQFFEGQFNADFTSAESFVTTSTTVFDAGLGIMYRAYLKNNIEFEFGGAIQHINQPNVNFTESIDASLPRTYGTHVRIKFPIQKKVDIIPELFYQQQGPRSEFLSGIIFNYYFNKSLYNTVALISGVHHRLNDATAISTGLGFKTFKTVFSYEINHSDFRVATNGYGASELSVIYVFQKLPEIGKKGTICPVF